MRGLPGLLVARVQRPDEQAYRGLEIKVRLELPVAHTLGERLQQSSSHGLVDPLPEALEEFGVTAFLSQKSTQDGPPVLPGQVDLQVFKWGQGVGARVPRRARKRLGRQGVDRGQGEVQLVAESAAQTRGRGTGRSRYTPQGHAAVTVLGQFAGRRAKDGGIESCVAGTPR
jgi:hypothetical protein